MDIFIENLKSQQERGNLPSSIFLGKPSLMDGILIISKREMLAFSLFRSSIRLYSTSGITFSFIYVVLPVVFADIVGGVPCGGKPLLLVLYEFCRSKTTFVSSSCSSLAIGSSEKQLIVLKNGSCSLLGGVFYIRHHFVYLEE